MIFMGFSLWELPQEQRKVSVQMGYSKKRLTIRMKNTCSSALHVEKGTIPSTTKKGADHGFGLQTMLEAAQNVTPICSNFCEKLPSTALIYGLAQYCPIQISISSCTYNTKHYQKRCRPWIWLTDDARGGTEDWRGHDVLHGKR